MASKTSSEEQDLLDELKRRQDEYDAVMPQYLSARADGSLSQTLKMRAQAAQDGLREIRRYWREVGEAAGNRQEWVAAVDNLDGPAPSLI